VYRYAYVYNNRKLYPCIRYVQGFFSYCGMYRKMCVCDKNTKFYTLRLHSGRLRVYRICRFVVCTLERDSILWSRAYIYYNIICSVTQGTMCFRLYCNIYYTVHSIHTICKPTYHIVIVLHEYYF
jgi:hypothetical protein